MPILLLITICVIWSLPATSNPHHEKREVAHKADLAPGYSPLQYKLPEAGSYSLPALGLATDGKVLDTQGRSRRLHDLFGDKPTVLSFIYTSCNDVNGCPLAAFVLRSVQNGIHEDPRLRDSVRLISVSFDPANDTPARLLQYSAHFRKPGFDWQFLTTSSERDLQPILEGYNQWTQREYSDDGELLGAISHILRVFLIDRDKQIRNIYSISFLHADTVLTDVRTISNQSVERHTHLTER